MSDPLTAVFIAKGMCEHHSCELAYDIALEKLSFGQVELFEFTLTAANVIDSAYDQFATDDWAHVFVYDVAEPTGDLIIDTLIHKERLPTEEETWDFATKIINDLQEKLA